MSSEAKADGRRPYKGSCHCGFIQYIIYLELPPLAPGAPQDEAKDKNSVRIYKCNCKPCHKMGLFHIRLPSPPDDFVLLSPLDSFKELGDYTCNKDIIHFPFCKKCGVRCFAIDWEGEVVEKEVDGEKKSVWVLKKPPEGEQPKTYLSINAHTIEAGQEGFDLREWHEKGWINYLDELDEKEEDRYDVPHRGGVY
ncbi:hypothetical protein EJ08DRAFT_655950 [Tothia fuscella]|uniref:CENP-V/GFA domain-containing protein n=1 Tax=Tothia fuscella TaxID=1048955 RepID=A0A9P4P456_9PEZI|nr:hypothetical protein EJ08DRAFT_655950 [Tothia fuscella]